MPSFVIPETIQWRWIWTLNDIEHAVSVVHLLNNAAANVNAAMANSLLAQLNVAINDASSGATLRSQIADNFKIAATSVRDINTANRPEIFDTSETTIIGGSASDPLPVQTALVTTFRTALAGKSFRGRWYGLGYSEGTNSATGEANAPVVASQQQFWSRLRGELDTLNLPLVVASRTLLESNHVVSHDTNVRWDTQRRRARPGI